MVVYVNRHYRVKRMMISAMILLLLLTSLAGCGATSETMEEVVHGAEGLPEEEAVPSDDDPSENEGDENAGAPTLDPDGFYTSRDEVALYLHLYGELPPNYINKSEAAKLGWQASKGNLWEVTDQMSIGGDRFGNREGLLPHKEGRQYYEVDIHYEGGYRGAERIVYSNDGLVYYTPDHYESFELLYGEE